MDRYTLRLSIALLAPIALLKADPGHCRPAAVDAAVAAPATAEERLPHISVVTMGTKGSPVILIPGLGSPRAVWDGIAPKLAETHRVYLVQVNGFSGDAPGANLEPGILDGIVADLHGYIGKHDLHAAAVIGHSMGGLVGLMLAKTHPDDLGKLMIVDSLPFIGPIMVPPGVPVTAAMLEPQARMLRDAMAARYDKPVDRAAIEQQVRILALKPDSLTKVVDWTATADQRVVGQALYEDMGADLRGELAAIKTPITLVYPWNTYLPQERAAAFYRAQYQGAVNISYAPIGDAAHFVMLDQPAAFAEAVTRFVGAD